MEKKDLKKLSRSELLEMLLDRSKEIEHLRRELRDANAKVKTLENEIKTIGSIDDSVDKLVNSTEVIRRFAAVIKQVTDEIQR